ncbi:hypothetical protein NEISICOT_03465 [Neisseria sicca ATCC 29256]|uniref:Uncharacterized protein n=1 Tax=Neisseria sicca ATCC 29256 TaxID=547045 RepID=C6MA83_NEISI|nr:hypothetical protein NEISICOT_03465 [Neisseria sicca ATCC 29256]
MRCGLTKTMLLTETDTAMRYPDWVLDSLQTPHPQLDKETS